MQQQLGQSELCNTACIAVPRVYHAATYQSFYPVSSLESRPRLKLPWHAFPHAGPCGPRGGVTAAAPMAFGLRLVHHFFLSFPSHPSANSPHALCLFAPHLTSTLWHQSLQEQLHACTGHTMPAARYQTASEELMRHAASVITAAANPRFPSWHQRHHCSFLLLLCCSSCSSLLL